MNHAARQTAADPATRIAMWSGPRTVSTALMRAWGEPPGPRDTDGVWAPYWYASVQASTGFAPYRPPAEPLPTRLEPLAAQCLPYFERLHRYRMGGPDAASLR